MELKYLIKIKKRRILESGKLGGKRTRINCAMWRDEDELISHGKGDQNYAVVLVRSPPENRTIKVNGPFFPIFRGIVL